MATRSRGPTGPGSAPAALVPVSEASFTATPASASITFQEAQPKRLRVCQRWSPAEDSKLCDLVEILSSSRPTAGDFAAIALTLGTGRTGEAVQQRWTLYLEPGAPMSLAVQRNRGQLIGGTYGGSRFLPQPPLQSAPSVALPPPPAVPAVPLPAALPLPVPVLDLPRANAVPVPAVRSVPQCAAAVGLGDDAPSVPVEELDDDQGWPCSVNHVGSGGGHDLAGCRCSQPLAAGDTPRNAAVQQADAKEVELAQDETPEWDAVAQRSAAEQAAAAQDAVAEACQHEAPTTTLGEQSMPETTTQRSPRSSRGRGSPGRAPSDTASPLASARLRTMAAGATPPSRRSFSPAGVPLYALADPLSPWLRANCPNAGGPSSATSPARLLDTSGSAVMLQEYGPLTSLHRHPLAQMARPRNECDVGGAGCCGDEKGTEWRCPRCDFDVCSVCYARYRRADTGVATADGGRTLCRNRSAGAGALFTCRLQYM